MATRPAAGATLTPKNPRLFFRSFFFNDTATTEIYTLSLHDALPISSSCSAFRSRRTSRAGNPSRLMRSEEHTSELQSHLKLVCRLLLEKKKNPSLNCLHGLQGRCNGPDQAGGRELRIRRNPLQRHVSCPDFFFF